MMAFGGVATGNMKAQDAPTAISTAKTIGGSDMASAIDINIGISKALLAVLLVISVRKIIKAADMSKNTTNGIPSEMLTTCSAR